MNDSVRGGKVMSDADIAEQFEKHLSSPQQTWLLGAGVSFVAKIPLMSALTSRVLALAKTNKFREDMLALHVLDFITSDCGPNSHIEHHLTHLGDLISIAKRSSASSIIIGNQRVEEAKLVEVHEGLIVYIASTIRWGFKAARRNGEEILEVEEEGQVGQSIVDISGHRKFIDAVFGAGRAGLDFVRSPIEFFTTNYDTLIEDALALSGIEYQDGFVGGGVGFWDISNYKALPGSKAIVSKLHGSIDWYRATAGKAKLLRTRFGDTYPGEGGSVMIYPQATKYVHTQRDPFAEIFQRFRMRLAQGKDHVLLVCGYSFGDDHINAEIELAMASGRSQLTIIAFTDEPDNQLPAVLEEWLSQPWAQQLYIASPKGLYRGKTGPTFSVAQGSRDWWTFDGVANLLATGLPKDIQETMS